jgi:Myb-like DNA-binding protein
MDDLGPRWTDGEISTFFDGIIQFSNPGGSRIFYGILFFAAFKEHGQKWKLVSSKLPGRTSKMVRLV